MRRGLKQIFSWISEYSAAVSALTVLIKVVLDALSQHVMLPGWLTPSLAVLATLFVIWAFATAYRAHLRSEKGPWPELLWAIVFDRAPGQQPQPTLPSILVLHSDADEALLQKVKGALNLPQDPHIPGCGVNTVSIAKPEFEKHMGSNPEAVILLWSKKWSEPNHKAALDYVDDWAREHHERAVLLINTDGSEVQEPLEWAWELRPDVLSPKAAENDGQGFLLGYLIQKMASRATVLQRQASVRRTTILAAGAVLMIAAPLLIVALVRTSRALWAPSWLDKGASVRAMKYSNALDGVLRSGVASKKVASHPDEAQALTDEARTYVTSELNRLAHRIESYHWPFTVGRVRPSYFVRVNAGLGSMTDSLKSKQLPNERPLSEAECLCEVSAEPSVDPSCFLMRLGAHEQSTSVATCSLEHGVVARWLAETDVIDYFNPVDLSALTLIGTGAETKNACTYAVRVNEIRPASLTCLPLDASETQKHQAVMCVSGQDVDIGLTKDSVMTFARETARHLALLPKAFLSTQYELPRRCRAAHLQEILSRPDYSAAASSKPEQAIPLDRAARELAKLAEKAEEPQTKSRIQEVLRSVAPHSDAPRQRTGMQPTSPSLATDVP